MIRTKLLFLALIILFNSFSGCKGRLFNNPFDPDRDERGYEIEATINLQNNLYPGDITFSGDSLWISNGSSTIYSVNHNSGYIIRTLDINYGSVTGIGYDGSSLWININNSYEIYKISIVSGEMIRKIKITDGDYSSLDFSGTSLFLADRKSNSIITIDPDSGEKRDGFGAPVFRIDGLCFDGEFFWILESSTLKIVKTDNRGNIINSFKSPSENPSAIACKGDILWLGDSNGKIYKLKVK